MKTFNASKKLPANGLKMLKSNPSTTSLYGTDVVSDEHKTLVESISKHIIYGESEVGWYFKYVVIG